MKPLVYWCRWHDARLRLMGRSPQEVWGELAFPDASQPFRFDLQAQRLTIGEGETQKILLLDEMGVEIK